MALIEHLEKLRHFYRLTNYRSIKSGAQEMGISQAGLSKCIANLESILEVQLFTRTSDGLVLTKEGELVLLATKKILNEANALETNLSLLKAAHAPSKFKIGMYDSIAIYFYPNLSTYMKEIYPRVEFELLVDRSSNLAAMINQNKIDLAVGVNLLENSRTKFYRIFEDIYSFYCSPKIMKEPSKLPIIFHPDATDQSGKTTLSYLSKALGSRISHQVYNFETIKELAVLGHGIGVLPTQVARPLINQAHLVQIKLPKLINTFGKHSIGILATKELLNEHKEFVEDLYRLGIRWSRS